MLLAAGKEVVAATWVAAALVGCCVGLTNATELMRTPSTATAKAAFVSREMMSIAVVRFMLANIGTLLISVCLASSSVPQVAPMGWCPTMSAGQATVGVTEEL